MIYGYTVMWVEDVVKTASFYEKAFGFKQRVLLETELTLWCELETGATTIALASYKEADALFGNYRRLEANEPPATILLSFVTDDVQSAYDHALANGAASISAPKVEPWGQTVARLRDINGVLVSLATPFTPKG